MTELKVSSKTYELRRVTETEFEVFFENEREFTMFTETVDCTNINIKSIRKDNGAVNKEDIYTLLSLFRGYKSPTVRISLINPNHVNALSA